MIDAHMVNGIAAMFSLTLLSGLFWFILRYAK